MSYTPKRPFAERGPWENLPPVTREGTFLVGEVLDDIDEAVETHDGELDEHGNRLDSVESGLSSVGGRVGSLEDQAAGFATVTYVDEQVAAGGLTPRGDWDPEVIYSAGDLVTHDEVAWVATGPTAGDEPGVDPVWQPLFPAPDGPGGGGAVNSVGASAPVTTTGGSDPVIGINTVTTSAAGAMSAADKTKLDGVQSGATANADDDQLRDRSTHTGTQTIGTVSGLQTALNNKADVSHSHNGGGVDVEAVHAELAKLWVWYDDGWPEVRPDVPSSVTVTWAKADPADPDPDPQMMGPHDVALLAQDDD